MPWTGISNPIRYCAVNPLDIMPPSVMDIRVCVTVICTVAWNCCMEIMIVYDGQCVCLSVTPSQDIHMGDCWKLACVGFMLATVLECQYALQLCAWLYPTTVPFLHAGCDCSFVGLRSFLPTFRLCALCCLIPSVVLWIGGSCFHFVALMFQQNCTEVYLLCQYCLNYNTVSNFWKQKHNWHPAEHPH